MKARQVNCIETAWGNQWNNKQRWQSWKGWNVFLEVCFLQVSYFGSNNSFWSEILPTLNQLQGKINTKITHHEKWKKNSGAKWELGKDVWPLIFIMVIRKFMDSVVYTFSHQYVYRWWFWSKKLTEEKFLSSYRKLQITKPVNIKHVLLKHYFIESPFKS